MQPSGRYCLVGVLGVIAVAASYSTASAVNAPDHVGLTASVAASTGGVTPRVGRAPQVSSHPTSCSIVAQPWELNAALLPLLPTRPQPFHRHEAGAAQRGSMTATIPRAVFVRVEGRDLVVTTNTGEAPKRRDTYYYVRDGHAGVAESRIVEAVRARCGALGS